MRFTKATAGPAGKKGGQARTPAKAVAASRNGQRGGRPKKSSPEPILTRTVNPTNLPDAVYQQMIRDHDNVP